MARRTNLWSELPRLCAVVGLVLTGAVLEARARPIHPQVAAPQAAPAQASRSAGDASVPLLTNQYLHDVWTVEDGLPQNSIYDVVQTADGYLWIATQAGLVRFDGVRFRVFDKQDGLASNEVRAILEARDGGLWVGTYGGGLVRMKDGRITTYTSADGLPSDFVRSLHEGRDSTLWVGTIEGGLARFDGRSFDVLSTADGLAGDVVLTIDEAEDGSLWIGTQAGLSRYRDQAFRNFTTADGLAGNLVWSLEPDGEGGYWVGSSGGLNRVSGGAVVETYGVRDGLCGEIVDALHRRSSGELLIGTLGGGICTYRDGRFVAFAEQNGLTDDRVRVLTVDREGSIWAGTESGGLNRFRRGKFTHLGELEGLSEDMTVTILEGAGSTWIGTKDAGLNRVDGDRIGPAGYDLPSDHIFALDESEGRLWVGMSLGGLCSIDEQRGIDEQRSIHQQPLTCYDEGDGLKSDNVFAVYAARDGRVWIGTDSGLSILKDGVISRSAEDALFDNKPITVIHEDRTGVMWVGSYDGGLTRIQGASIERFSAEDGAADETVLALQEGDDGAMWIGTYGGGLCRIGGGATGCITTRHGLSSDHVVQLLLDDVGGIWLGTQKGIVRIGLEAAVDVIEGRAETIEVTPYGRADGLRGSEVNGGTQPSAWKARDGRLYFTTNRGVAIIDPSYIEANLVPPPVHVEYFAANEERVSIRDDLRLRAGTRDLTVRYTATSFVAPEEVEFQYKLEGYDADWVDAGNRREAYYTNLAPGDYTFRVKAANNDGVWNEEGDSVSFYLEPFFYQTWWFAMLCALAAIGLAFAGFRLRIRQMKLRERDLERQVDDRTRDLRREKERTEEAKLVIEGQATKLRSLNDDLEEQAEKLRDLNENLQVKVQEQFELLVKERERYESDLIDAKDRAEASDRLKTAILNNLSHEFRTPLTAILGFTEIIAMEAPEDLQEFTAEIDRGGKRLLRTLDALLEFSRLEADESGMRPEEVDLTTTAIGIVREMKTSADHKNLALHFKAPAPVRAMLDGPALEEIIWNLLDNAIKFTHEGEVDVQAGSDGDRAFVRVRDTGVGIGPAFRERMYEAFAQESDGFSRSFEGVGLGLTITKRLVEHMGGTIDVETEPGRGSTFTVSFPMNGAFSDAA